MRAVGDWTELGRRREEVRSVEVRAFVGRRGREVVVVQKEGVSWGLVGGSRVRENFVGERAPRGRLVGDNLEESRGTLKERFAGIVVEQLRRSRLGE